MKKIMRILPILISSVILFHNHAIAQEGADEPIELTRLREQFSNRIDQEMKPWRDRYAQELQKLEDRLIKERKLEEALAVKNEKENYLGVDLSKKPEKAMVPATLEKAREAMIGSVWLVYASEDKKRENLLDVYYFKSSNQVYLTSSRQLFPWTMISKNELSVKVAQGDVEITVDFSESKADSTHLNREGVMFKAGVVDLGK